MNSSQEVQGLFGSIGEVNYYHFHFNTTTQPGKYINITVTNMVNGAVDLAYRVDNFLPFISCNTTTPVCNAATFTCQVKYLVDYYLL